MPCDPKLLVHHFDKPGFVKYRYDSSLEAAHKFDLLSEPDLGIPIDLVDPAAYERVEGAKLAPEDAELLGDTGGGAKIRRSHWTGAV